MQGPYLNEGVWVEDAPACYLCGARGVTLYANLRDRLFAAPGVWGLARCPACGLVWLDPKPLPADLGKLYTTYYTHAEGSSSTRSSALRRAVLAAAFGYPDRQMHMREKIIGRVLSWIGPSRDLAGGSVMWLDGSCRGRLLDVGCGAGLLLAEMRAFGWDVVGVDPDPDAVSGVRERYGIEAHHGSLEEARFPDESFDVVTMSHVIEHLSDPVETVRECRRVLKPGGRLIVVTPNTGSLGRRHFGAAWMAWDPPRHLYLFSPATLRPVFERAGLRVLVNRTTARGALFTWQLSALIRRHGPIPGRYARPSENAWTNLRGLLFWVAEHFLCRVRPVGEECVGVAVKP